MWRTDRRTNRRADRHLARYSPRYAYASRGKNYEEQEIRSVTSVQCNFFIFDHVTFIQFKICCCVQNFMKIGWFFARYGDITMFKMAAVRHLGTVLPLYETTHEVSVAGRSCLSNFTSIWYTDLNIIAIWIFRIFGLKWLFIPRFSILCVLLSHLFSSF